MNLAVIGYGGMGSYHVKTLIPEQNPGVQVVGIYDIDPTRQKEAEKNGLQVFPDLETLLADKKVEAVLIATPNDSHKELAIASLKAGKQVICEKPVAMNVADLDEILAVAEETGNTFMVHQNRRWDPDFLIIRDLYRQKQIGDLFQIESRVQGANGIPGDWRHLKQHGGGMILDWGVHLFDQMLFLVDSPIKDIAVDLSFILGDEVDDGFIVYLTFEDGLRSLIEVGTTNYTKLPRWYVKGIKGTAKIDDWDLSGEIIASAENAYAAAPAPIQAGVGLTKTMAPPSEDAVEVLSFPEAKAEYPTFYENFAAVVAGQAEPIVKNAEVRRVMLLIEKIFELAEEEATSLNL
ncbi:Gfo/Idh/MocA family protein [Enterococcus sp. HY326]|uniref:Gfo/Idh/MocA family protein n=1 Tax=Enterococcus sp. HY326 TaxID=2971265 RepID=UPI0022409B64|nr:Gfo/Idh/MocA family oxidoreductase [Enterococcus sp. HY326]